MSFCHSNTPGHRTSDLVGRTFNNWTVLRFDKNTPNGPTYWFCRCSCGTERTVIAASLINGHSSSCGCTRRAKTKKCETCLREFIPRWHVRRFCSKSCSGRSRKGADHPAFKHGLHGGGYRLITVDGEQVLEHRHIMEKHIGRKLLPHEVVHHKDEDKTNNNISNLEIMTNSDHSYHHHKTTFLNGTHKQCSVCREVKLHEMFARVNNPRSRSGLRSRCKACDAVSRKASLKARRPL